MDLIFRSSSKLNLESDVLDGEGLEFSTDNPETRGLGIAGGVNVDASNSGNESVSSFLERDILD